MRRSVGATSNWRSRIDAASPAEKQAVICQAVREAVGSVLRVKPDSLRDDQPLTDLGLDSLMGVEIETSLEAAVGVALPPTSLMRARTIGQIASLIAGHLGGAAPVAESTPVSAQTEATSAVDLDAISDEEIERLLGRESDSEETESDRRRQALSAGSCVTAMPADQRARLKQWLDRGEAQLHPLTFPQRELWEVSPVPVEDNANHICCLINVHGLLTERECRAAIQRVVDRQEVLRLSILPGKERPLQMIRKSCGINFEFREVAPNDAQPEAIEELAAEIFRAPFDFVQGPLYRAADLRRAANDHVLVFAIHHAIADGWSLGVLVQDLFAAYIEVVMGSSEPLPPVPQTYTAWGATERAFWQPAVVEQRVEFWRTKLAGSLRMWNLPITPGPPKRWLSAIPANLTNEIARTGPSD